MTKKITIVFKNGYKITWQVSEQGKYTFDGKLLSVEEDDKYAAFYNFDSITSVIIELGQ